MLPNLSVTVGHRSAVDFTVPGRLACSRLTADQFEDILRDGTAALIDLADSLADTGLHRLLMIEGGPYAVRTFPLARLASTLSYLQNVHRIHLLPTMNQRHSAYALVQAIKHTIYGLSEDAVSKADPIPIADRSPGTTAITMLRTIPGISSAKADALALVFPDMKSIMHASRSDLMKANGIGSALAKTIQETFSASFERSDRHE